MKINSDYTIAHQAMIVGKNKMDNANGVFIGTKKHFFFFPAKSFTHDQALLQNTLTTSKLFYEGKPLNEYILEKVQQPYLTLESFENFVTKELKSEIPDIKIEAIEDIHQFKTEAKWYYSAVTVNKSKMNRKWMPFAMQFKKDKNAISQFYITHPKLAK